MERFLESGVVMLVVRSLLFNVAFYANLIIRMVLLTPVYFLLPRQTAYEIPKSWARSSNWLMARLAGTTFEVEGLENIPEGGCIFSLKHQAFWDTFGLLPLIRDPVYILKRELMKIPLFGWYLAKQKMIPVDRGAKGRSALEMLKRAKQEMADGRQLIIYPEGTRLPPGADPQYKYGISRIYRSLGVPVVPVVMHPGLFWPRRSFRRYPGHFKVRILPPIAPGLGADEFFEQLITVMETASDALLVETVRDNPHVPLPPTAIRKLAELQAGTP